MNEKLKNYLMVLNEAVCKSIEQSDVLNEAFETLMTSLENEEEKKEVKVSEKGEKILAYMKDNEDMYSNTFTAKSIANDLDESPRSISGSMRSLCAGGYVEKEQGTSPIVYKITELGRNF